MIIKVLGTGCPKCSKLYAQAEQAIVESGRNIQLEKVDQIDEIMNYGVMMTPALVVDEEVKCTGKIPKTIEILTWINEGTQE